MGTSKDEVDTSENTFTNKITAIEIMATDFERRITGYKQTGKGNKWEYVGSPLVGQECASRLSGLMQSFANKANLLSKKDTEKVPWQRYHNVQSAIDSMLLDIGCPEKNYGIVIEMFWQTLSNILDITKSSRSMFEKMFSAQEEDIKPNNNF